MTAQGNASIGIPDEAPMMQHKRYNREPVPKAAGFPHLTAR
jgi:hypothetical protein